MTDSLVGWDARLVLGMLAGGAWNLVNLYCLARLLRAWLGPQRSTRRVAAWLLAKFGVLYVMVFWLLRLPTVSPVGFGLGFTVVLITAVWLLALRTRRLVHPVAYDR